MCDVCEKDRVLLSRDIVEDWMFGWIGDEGTIKVKDIQYSTYNILVDRGFLRFVDAEDCQCLDHGQRIPINYCPMCGEKI